MPLGTRNLRKLIRHVRNRGGGYLNGREGHPGSKVVVIGVVGATHFCRTAWQTGAPKSTLCSSVLAQVSVARLGYLVGVCQRAGDALVRFAVVFCAFE